MSFYKGYNDTSFISCDHPINDAGSTSGGHKNGDTKRASFSQRKYSQFFIKHFELDSSLSFHRTDFCLHLLQNKTARISILTSDESSDDEASSNMRRLSVLIESTNLN